MRHHTHLALSEREDIMILRREGESVSGIARAIGRDKSTASREISRNMCAKGTCCEYYRASTAQKRYEDRRMKCRGPRILDDECLFELVRGKFLDEQWSPEQIEGRLALELGAPPVSDTTIYRGIHQGRFDACICGLWAGGELCGVGLATPPTKVNVLGGGNGISGCANQPHLGACYPSVSMRWPVSRSASI